MRTSTASAPGTLPAERSAAGDRSGFEEFVDANGTALYRALCLVTHDPDEAEDVEQEAFVRVLERWERVSRLDDPTGYLYRTAMNVCRSRWRHARLAMRKAMALAPRREAPDDPEGDAVLMDALAALPTDQREALVVTSLLGYPSDEAAEILGTKPSTVRTRATRARAALRARMGDEP